MMKIVIVEDEVRVRAGIVRLIRRERPAYTVAGEADNGVDGMLLIKECNPQLVITDIRMPRMSGLKMLENLAASSIRPSVVILTAHADFEYAKTAIRFGVVDYLLKPVTAAELTNVLDRIAPPGQEQTSPDSSPHAQPPHSPMVQEMMSHIQSHYPIKICLEDFAERFHVTSAYLSALFSRETGSTFSAFLRSYRVEKAKELLCGGECLIYEIAYRTGFDDVQYFCRVFKSVTGYSATEYMRYHQDEKNAL